MTLMAFLTIVLAIVCVALIAVVLHLYLLLHGLLQVLVAMNLIELELSPASEWLARTAARVTR